MLNRPLKILLVDDEKGLLNNLARFFEDEGYYVLIANNGEEALDILTKEQVDGAIVDMRLPGIDGNEVILQAYHMQPTIKFIIHTGSTNYFLPTALRDLGVVEGQIHIKPVADMAILSEHMQQLIQGKDYDN